ncbi:signal transduction histidine kinase, partial [Kockovaella imperatae]
DGIIDEETFSQIREMDDPDDPELFSAGIVFGFFDQAEQTFGEMRRAISEKNLEQLSSLGHFLKGSSAALGVFKVQAICETIQNNGKMRDEVRDENITSEDALKRIKDLLRNAELEYRIAKAWFLKLYPDGGPEGGDEED